MALYKSKGIVLKHIKLGEADKIAILFAPRHGKIRAVAKGLRKTKSKFGSRLEPFTFVDLLLYEGRELDIINQAEIITSFREIRSDLEKFKYGSVMLELIDKIAQEREESSRTFVLFLSALEALKAAPDRYDQLLALFELKLMSLIGYKPRLEVCVACGSETAGPGTVFSMRYGGFLCADCKGKDPSSLKVGKATRDALIKGIELPWADWRELDLPRETGEELVRLVERYVSYHLDHTLKSARLLTI